MIEFTIASTRRAPSVWGGEVKKRLIDRGLRQADLVQMLKEKGFDVDKHSLANLLYGVGSATRQGEVEFISRLLDIPYHG